MRLVIGLVLGGQAVAAVAHAAALLLENGSLLLMEDGSSFILLE